MVSKLLRILLEIFTVSWWGLSGVVYILKRSCSYEMSSACFCSTQILTLLLLVLRPGIVVFLLWGLELVTVFIFHYSSPIDGGCQVDEHLWVKSNDNIYFLV